MAWKNLRRLPFVGSVAHSHRGRRHRQLFRPRGLDETVEVGFFEKRVTRFARHAIPLASRISLHFISQDDRLRSEGRRGADCFSQVSPYMAQRHAEDTKMAAENASGHVFKRRLSARRRNRGAGQPRPATASLAPARERPPTSDGRAHKLRYFSESSQPAGACAPPPRFTIWAFLEPPQSRTRAAMRDPTRSGAGNGRPASPLLCRQLRLNSSSQSCGLSAHVAAVDPGFYVNLPADIAGVGSRCCKAAANYSPVGVATGWRMRANNNRSFCVG
jgi:hypothetical protein